MSAQGPNLAELEVQASDDVAAATSEQALAEVRASYLGRKGSVAGVLRSIGSLEPKERGRVGKEANEVKTRIEALVTARKSALAKSSEDQSLSDHRLDVSLPGEGKPLGHLHPLTQVQRDMEDFFWSRGYSIEEGPEVETEHNNFNALNIPADHPAREMQDTFWVQDGHVLRTHTSPVQIRAMSEREPPFYIVAPGRVYRHDLSPRHSPMFSQVEGFAVDENLSFGDLKGLLFAFASHMMGAAMELRFRSSYFPFTEPSAEMDFRCLLCLGEGCATCSQSGWIEWGGCGMIHPQVLRNCDIDPDRWQGFAFGMGLERVAMLRHGLSHIRLLYEGDMRVLEQF